ncbi:MAG TPA: squalene synthase HpnC [Rhizomicrobium sp.]|nr:squalene synthase HpnC [Rhizomicrobium sp.]
MTDTPSALASGKGHTDENFPVASVLIHPRHRPSILAFYRFARTADDVADHPTATQEEKLRLLEDMRQSLNGNCQASPEGVALRQALGARGLSSQHALDLLEAFRRDVTKRRYADWKELMDYCRYSAMPVGRFVLDVHGEDRRTWPYNDALCAALQVINHLQDCAKDYRALDRVYLPLDAMKLAGAGLEDLEADKATPALRRVIASLAQRTDVLLSEARPFASMIADFRLGLEVTVIQRLAESLNRGLLRKDPLSERVHHRKSEMLGLALVAATRFSLTRSAAPRPAP